MHKDYHLGNPHKSILMSTLEILLSNMNNSTSELPEIGEYEIPQR